MKIVVCNPPGTFPGNRYPCPFPSRWTSMFHNYPVFTFFPYELAYCTSLLKRDLPQHQVKMVDGTWLRFSADEYVRWLENEKPDVLVFETDTVTYHETMKVALAMKRKHGTTVIMTGQYSTVNPQAAMADGCDYACVGEYEETVRDILRGDDPKGIAGLYPNGYRKVLDLDALPDPEDGDIRRIDYAYSGGCRWTKYRSIEVHASRGCPYSCDFCVAGTVYYEKPNWRFRSPARIVNEIETLRRKYPAIEGAFFNEETHIIKKSAIMAFCDAIIESGNNDLHYEAMANHQALDEEILEKLKKAGYYKLRIGIETIDPATSQSIGRKTKANRLLELLRESKKLGIEMYGTFIIGASGSTRAGDVATIEYGAKLLEEGLLSSWQASIAVPHPGTPFYDKAKENKWLTTDDPELFNGISGSVLSYPNYSSEEIKGTVDIMAKRFDVATKNIPAAATRSIAAEKLHLPAEKRDEVRERLNALTALFNTGDNAAALALGNAILAQYPQLLRARHLIGSVHERMGDYGKAREYFTHIVEAATDYDSALQHAGRAHFHLGWMAYQEGEQAAARRHFEHCMHLCPDHRLARRYYWLLVNPQGALAEEDAFWSGFESGFSANGALAAPSIDLCNAQKSGGLTDFWADPQVDGLLRGPEKQRLIAGVARPQVSTVLEIGCGAGWLALELARAGKKVTGVDVSGGRISAARRYAEKNGLAIEYHQGDVLAFLEQSGRKFDRIVAWDSLHHIPHVARLMRAIAGALEPGGRLVTFDHVGGDVKEHRAIANVLMNTSRMSYLPRYNGNGGAHFDEALSPCEDVGSFLLEETISRNMNVLERSSHLAFTPFIASAIDFPASGLALLSELKAMEEAMIRSGLLRGRYIYIEAAPHGG